MFTDGRTLEYDNTATLSFLLCRKPGTKVHEFVVTELRLDRRVHLLQLQQDKRLQPWDTRRGAVRAFLTWASRKDARIGGNKLHVMLVTFSRGEYHCGQLL